MSELKICAREGCGQPFYWSPAHPHKKYCTWTCGKMVAEKKALLKRKATS